MSNFVPLFSLFLLLTFMPIGAGAQGIPFIRNYPATEYKAHKQNFDIICSPDGTVYVANFEGLLYMDHSQWRIIHTPGITRITSVFCDSKGIIWTGGYNYIGHVENDHQGNLQLHGTENASLFEGEVKWIWEKQAVIYFLASDNKIYSIHDNQVQLAPGESLPKTGRSVLSERTHVNQEQELDGGLRAIATNGDGLIITDREGRELMRITEANGLCSDNVNHITYNGHGIIYGATDNGIFSIAFPSAYTRFTPSEGLHGEVLSIGKMDDRIYAGTLSGLYMQDGLRFVPVEGVNYACWQLQPQDMTLLAATTDGIYRIRPGNRTEQLTTANTLSLMVTEDGFYSGEMDGVYFNSSTGRKKVSEAEKVVKIIADKQGTIWMQNLYGKVWKAFQPYSNSDDANVIMTLVRYKGEVIPVNTNSTKPFDYPAFDYEDPTGVLWLTDNKGKSLYAFRDGERDSTQSSLVYPLMDNSVRAMLYDGNLLWMGGDKGITVADKSLPEPAKRVKSSVKIRSVEVRDSIVWGGFGKTPDMLPTLADDFNRITISYSIGHHSLLLRTQYRYRLNGASWTAWSNETFEDFPNLPSGRYTFEVQSRDAYGQVSEPAGISFVILKPWYWRWYMILAYLLAAGALFYQFIRWRTRRLEKEKHYLETVVQERTAEVVKLEKVAAVAKLTQGLIDRILNPLNYINNFAKLSEGLVRDARANIEDEEEHMGRENYEDTMDVFDMLQSNLQKVGEHGASTTRTLKAMEEMLKNHSGGIVRMNLTSLLHQDREMLLKYFEKEITQYHIKVVFDLPEREISINGNAEHLSKTFMSILGNAIYAVIKQSQRKQSEGATYVPEIRCSALQTSQKTELRFRDNGVGIEHTVIDKIFDPFFTTKTTGEASGIGLYLSREILQNHGGDISVESEKNVYTEFTITLPSIS